MGFFVCHLLGCLERLSKEAYCQRSAWVLSELQAQLQRAQVPGEGVGGRAVWIMDQN